MESVVIDSSDENQLAIEDEEFHSIETQSEASNVNLESEGQHVLHQIQLIEIPESQSALEIKINPQVIEFPESEFIGINTEPEDDIILDQSHANDILKLEMTNEYYEPESILIVHDDQNRLTEDMDTNYDPEDQLFLQEHQLEVQTTVTPETEDASWEHEAEETLPLDYDQRDTSNTGLETIDASHGFSGQLTIEENFKDSPDSSDVTESFESQTQLEEELKEAQPQSTESSESEDIDFTQVPDQHLEYEYGLAITTEIPNLEDMVANPESHTYLAFEDHTITEDPEPETAVSSGTKEQVEMEQEQIEAIKVSALHDKLELHQDSSIKPSELEDIKLDKISQNKPMYEEQVVPSESPESEAALINQESNTQKVIENKLTKPTENLESLEEPTRIQATDSPEWIEIDVSADSEEKIHFIGEKTEIQATESPESIEIDVSTDSEEKIQFIGEQNKIEATQSPEWIEVVVSDSSEAIESTDTINVVLSDDSEEKIEFLEEPTKTQATESPESIVVDEGADSEEKPDVMEEQTKIQTTELSESADVDVSDDSDDKIELMEEQMSQATESFDMVNVNLSANFEEKIELMVEQNQTQSTDFFESIDVNSSDDSEEEIKITEEQTLIQATESSDTVVIDGNHHFDDSTELMDEETQEIKVGEITMINCNDETGNQHVSQLQDELSHSTESYESEGENDTTYVNK